jgi:hypothetical protein
MPVLRIDHIPIEAMLLGVRQVSYKREGDPDSGEMIRWLLTNFSRREQKVIYKL